MFAERRSGLAERNRIPATDGGAGIVRGGAAAQSSSVQAFREVCLCGARVQEALLRHAYQADAELEWVAPETGHAPQLRATLWCGQGRPAEGL
jgi:hypothetical protein